jgi:formate dehydrogenase major subunit
MSVLEPDVLHGLPLAAVANLPTTAIETGTWKYLEPHYEDKLPPCAQACPAGNDISKATALLAAGDVSGAARLVRSGNPLPATLGRVCPHPCERPCNRESLGGAIAVHMLERFLGDASLGNDAVPPKAPPTGHKVAIIGSGPAGIAAAYSLALLGHEVEVFDDKPRPGGYLRTGIPDYRLPKRILEREIALVEQTGVKFHQSIRVGRDITFRELRNSFHAVIVAVGLHASRSLGVPGSDHPHVYEGVQLLEEILLGGTPQVPREMAVVGGGNTAVDVARSLMRLGVKATIVYRRTEVEMPAIAAEVEQATHEGVEFRFLAAPSAVIWSATRCGWESPMLPEDVSRYGFPTRRFASRFPELFPPSAKP